MQLALVVLAFTGTGLAVVLLRVASIAREHAAHAPLPARSSWRTLAVLLLAVALVAPLLAAGAGPVWLAPAFELALGGAGLLVCAQRKLQRAAWPFGLALLLGALAFAAREEAALQPTRSGLALYLLAAAPLLAAPAWPHAKQTLPDALEHGRAPPESLWLAYGGVAALGCIAAYTTWRSGFDLGLAGVLFALAFLAMVGGLLRPGLAPLALIQAAAAAAAIALWPEVSRLEGVLLLEPRPFGTALLSLTAAFGGALLLGKRADPWSGGLLAAFGPVAAFAAAALWPAFGLKPLWAGAALALAALELLAFERSGKEQGPRVRDMFALAASLALLLAFVLSGAVAFATPAALACFALASLAMRAGGALLALCAAGFGGLAAIAAMNSLVAAASWPNLALAPLDAGAAAVTLWLAKRRIANASGLPGGAVVETALALCAVSSTLAVANLAADMLQAEALTLTGAHALALLLGAFALGRARWLTPLVRGRAEAGLLGAAAIYALLAGLSVFNPWWGMSPAAAPGWPMLNPLIAAYALPAIGFALFARLRRGPEAERLRQVAMFTASALFALWGLLEARRWLSGADLTFVAAPPGQLAWAGAVFSALCALGLVALTLGDRALASRPRLAGPAPSGLPLPARLRPMPWSRAPKGDPNLAPPL